MTYFDRNGETTFTNAAGNATNVGVSWDRLTKGALDKIGAIGMLIAFSPLFALIWLFAKIDGGPAIFAHKRIGQNGKSFYCLKFRTMVVDAGERLEQILASDPAARAEWDAFHKLTDDPRITRIGHFLRKTSLDELPQIINVLRGEMSLVGPRPVVAEELERYGIFAKEAFSVLPGITGLWQVGGRNDISYQERVQNDVTYVRNQSFFGDIGILLATVKVVLLRTGK